MKSPPPCYADFSLFIAVTRVHVSPRTQPWLTLNPCPEKLDLPKHLRGHVLSTTVIRVHVAPPIKVWAAANHYVYTCDPPKKSPILALCIPVIAGHVSKSPAPSTTRSTRGAHPYYLKSAQTHAQNPKISRLARPHLYPPSPGPPHTWHPAHAHPQKPKPGALPINYPPPHAHI